MYQKKEPCGGPDKRTINATIEYQLFFKDVGPFLLTPVKHRQVQAFVNQYRLIPQKSTFPTIPSLYSTDVPVMKRSKY